MPTEEIKGGIFSYIRFTSNYSRFFYRLHWFCSFLKPVQNLIALEQKNIFNHELDIKGSIFLINSFNIKTNF